MVVALAVMAVLVVQSREHRQRYAELYERAAYPHIGGFVPSFEAETMEGNRVVIGERPEGGTQTLFVFNTACPYCLASLSAWSAS